MSLQMDEHHLVAEVPGAVYCRMGEADNPLHSWDAGGGS